MMLVKFAFLPYFFYFIVQSNPMKRRHFFILLLFLPLITLSHPRSNGFDYSIIFIGSFENDIVSLSLNKVLVLDRYKVENADSIKRGHLSLTQYDNEIKVYYNGAEITRSRIDVSFILNAVITINGKLKKIKLDLRKGKVILIDHVPDNPKKAEAKKLRIEQIDEPVILM